MKTIFNKFMSLLLITLLIITIIPIQPSFALDDDNNDPGIYEYFTQGDFKFVKWEHSSYAGVAEYIGTDEEIILPSEINGYRVTYIAGRAFMNCRIIKSVTIPDSIDSIGYEAFKGCNNLISVDAPKELYYIHEQAFMNCTNLETINISDSVWSIANDAFLNCPNVVLIVGNDSYAIRYAYKNNIKFSPTQPVLAKAICVNPLIFTPGDTWQMKCTIDPGYCYSDVSWSSSNTSCVKISESGKLTAVAYGKATITASAAGKSGKATIKVVPKQPVGFKTSARTTTSLTLSWPEQKGVSYTIHKLNNKTGYFEKVITTSKNTYTVTKLSAGIE